MKPFNIIVGLIWAVCIITMLTVDAPVMSIALLITHKRNQMLIQNRENKEKVKNSVTFYLPGRGHVTFDIDGYKSSYYVSDWMLLRQKSIEFRTKPMSFYNWVLKNHVKV